VHEHGSRHADDEGPAELGDVRSGECGEIGQGERERPVPRPCVQADEHERADARGKQAGQQDRPQHGPPDADRLHEQERAAEWGPDEGADGREAARGCDHGERLLGHVPSCQPHGRRGEAAADRDERRLRADHRSESQTHQRGGRDAEERQGSGWPAARVEAVQR
jgi:hypothetical protein